jgi:targeting protein for Xklp2
LGETSIRKSITIKEQGALEEMTDSTQPTVLPDGIGQSWNCKFWEDFTTPNCLQDRFWHPCGSGKWKWDAVSWKEIHWEPACSQIVQDPATQKSILRVCVFSDWFHRIDRLATKEQFGYGYYEARCRFKGASGMHSAFWLLPNAMDEVDTSPGLIPGGIEVDVVEHRGFNATNNDISTIGVTTMHWGGYGAHHHSAGYRESSLPTSNCDTWATYGVLHMPGGLRWFWNGAEVNSVPIWSSRSNFLYFSTEVNESGGWAGTDMSSYGTLADPAGYVEVDHCGFWEVQSSSPSPLASLSDSHEQPHEEL